MAEYIWKLTLKDGRVIPIPPQHVGVVRHKYQRREPIKTTQGDYPFSEIKSFEPTSRTMEPVPLDDQAAQAFKDPVITQDEDGRDMVKARWVKKQITTQEWSGKHAKVGMYRKLGDAGGGMVWVAFIQPVHQINTRIVQYCSPEDVRYLERN